jgi:hypothetical protein
MRDPFSIVAIRIRGVQKVPEPMLGPPVVLIVDYLSKQNRRIPFILQKQRYRFADIAKQ